MFEYQIQELLGLSCTIIWKWVLRHSSYNSDGTEWTWHTLYIKDWKEIKKEKLQRMEILVQFYIFHLMDIPQKTWSWRKKETRQPHTFQITLWHKLYGRLTSRGIKNLKWKNRITGWFTWRIKQSNIEVEWQNWKNGKANWNVG